MIEFKQHFEISKEYERQAASARERMGSDEKAVTALVAQNTATAEATTAALS